MSIHRPIIHLWAPGIGEGSGGIQGFSRECVAALQSSFPGHDLRVLIKNDQIPANDALHHSQTHFTSSGRVPEKLRTAGFAAKGIAVSIADRPDLIVTTHLHFLPALRLAARINKAPIAVVAHGIEVWDLKPGSRLNALRKADAILSVSTYTSQRMMALGGMDATRIHPLPNTFNVDRYIPGPKPPVLLERYGLRLDQPVLFTVSRLAASEQYKGHEQVLQALPTVAKTSPDVRYLIAGTGDYTDTLKQRAAELGLADRVIFAGFIPNDELAAHYQLCDAFVMPSRKEGFGIVFLEAMGCGKPVIGGNKDGSVDALDGGRLGALVDPLNIEELAASIGQVLMKTHPNRLLFDPQALHDAAVATFGPDAFRQRLHDALVPLLKSLRN